MFGILLKIGAWLLEHIGIKDKESQFTKEAKVLLKGSNDLTGQYKTLLEFTDARFKETDRRLDACEEERTVLAKAVAKTNVEIGDIKEKHDDCERRYAIIADKLQVLDHVKEHTENNTRRINQIEDRETLLGGVG